MARPFERRRPRGRVLAVLGAPPGVTGSRGADLARGPFGLPPCPGAFLVLAALLPARVPAPRLSPCSVCALQRAEPATAAQRGQLACSIAEPPGRAALSVGDLVVLRGDLLVSDSH